MATRRYGPTRGAGVTVQEQPGGAQIAVGALGWCGYAGVFEKGPVGALIVASTKKMFNKKLGSIIPESLAPDAAEDFYNVANGAGGLVFVRVTDGNELKAYANLYSRKFSASAPTALMGKLEAKNGGRWGGREKFYTGLLSSLSNLTETTLTTGLTGTFTTDEWKGAYIELPDVPNKRYPITGNTAAGVFTVNSDLTMKTDLASGSDLRYYFVLPDNADKRLTFTIADGEDLPDTEFSITVYVDGQFIKKYPNLNTDPNSAHYWVNIINNDDGNDEIWATDYFTGTHTALVRPSNYYGSTSAVTKSTLTPVLGTLGVTVGPVGALPTLTIGTTTDDNKAQVITITMTSATVGTAVSDKYGAVGTITLGTLFVPTNKYIPPFTVIAGGTALVATNIVTIYFTPMRANELVGGFLYPDKVNQKREKYRIIANTHKLITISAGNDLTVSGAISDLFSVEYPQKLTNGRDGNADLTDASFQNQAWDNSNSPFKRVVGQNFGVIKFSTPGVTAQAVQQSGKNFAEANNHQYRYETPANVVTEQSAIAWINETLGRSDYAVNSFPSFGYVSDPDPAAAREGKLKLTTLTGQIHGRESRIAADYDGYHKAAAGIEATLPALLKLPTLDAILDEEQLNPVGISVIKKKRGNFVIWGDRTLYLDSQWKFKHQREQMSYYEQVLMENFDFIIFALNDPDNDQVALQALKLFFLPEHTKRALRGKKFEDACVLKVDSENNTDATRATGDMFADVSLRLADTVERFNIRIGKQGVFESVS